MIVQFIFLIWVFACTESEKVDTGSSEPYEPTEEHLLLDLIEQMFYRFSDQAGRRKWYARCETLRPTFEKAAALTGYETEFAMGMALHESAGCQKGIKGRHGEIGLMQIRSSTLRDFRKEAAKLLEIKSGQVNLYYPFHNAVLGLVVLRSRERGLGEMESANDFANALQSYNRGASGYKRSLAKHFGWSSGDPLPFVLDVQEAAGHCEYAQMIFAAAAEIRLNARSVNTSERDFLNPIDIPGWYREANKPPPAKDEKGT
ncbi:MAG: transglycosylase SLT domain-containing protein [bacterium]